MTTLYLDEPGLYLEKNGNRAVIKRKAEKIKEVPLEKITNVVLIGRSHLTSPLITEFLNREIPVTWLSHSGKFYGRLESTTGVNIERQRQQFRMAENPEFCLILAKSFITGKIRNSRVVIRNYNRNKNLPEITNILDELKIYTKKAEQAKTIEEILGYEGNSSRLYFKAMSALASPTFKFSGRTRQPPTDFFNSLLSFGYTLLMYEFYTVIVNKGLHPYLAFLHKIRRGHPALCSDLMEEWRPVIVDSLVMNIAQNDIYKPEYFVKPDKADGGVFLDRDNSKDFIKRFENKIRYSTKYLPYVDYPTSFRESIMFQAGAIARAVEEEDPSLYRPVLIR